MCCPKCPPYCGCPPWTRVAGVCDCRTLLLGSTASNRVEIDPHSPPLGLTIRTGG